MDRRAQGLLIGISIPLLILALLAMTRRGDPRKEVVRLQDADAGAATVQRYGGASTVTVRELAPEAVINTEKPRRQRRTAQPDDNVLSRTQVKRERQVRAREQRVQRQAKRHREAGEHEAVARAPRRSLPSTVPSGVTEETATATVTDVASEAWGNQAASKKTSPTIGGNPLPPSDFLEEVEATPNAAREARKSLPPRKETVIPRREDDEPSIPREDEIVEGEEIITEVPE